MDILDKIITLADDARDSGNYKLAMVLTRIATDVGLVETNRHFIAQFKQAHAEVLTMKKNLNEAHLYKASEELDIIARDLESRIIVFEAEDPIEAVLDSYKIIHKVAKVHKESSRVQEILSIVDQNLSDEQIISELKRETMGLTLGDKQNILYVLEKDYNITIPLEKIANFDTNATTKDRESKFIQNPKTQNDIEHNHRLVAKVLKEYQSLPTEEREKFKLPASFPSQPYMWGGFAYESTIPYDQSSQLNYWSLASTKENKILKKIAKTPK